ncbi:MAG: hypothetical protein JRH06_01245 [Deltaproteobacteria bacterium]|nr:hypothetical protein [Deltaproteobacteria bacterium]MBW2136165.1 hypothetical protein [Deltaproteobacteria bacterium]
MSHSMKEMPGQGFVIESKGFELELGIAGVESLFFHERVVHGLLEDLMAELSKCGILKNPVIIDRNNIVLDGNHRAFAFKKLGLRFIPTCKVDYFHRDIRLRYWFRLLRGVDSLIMVRARIEEAGGTLWEVANIETLEDKMKENPYSWGIQKGHSFACVLFDGDRVSDAVSAYDTLEGIQGKLKQRGVELEYIPCSRVHEEGFSVSLRDDELVILTPLITKEMVVEAVKAGKTFAPKSTRHLIPVRPVNVNTPIGWFEEDISLEEMKGRFKALLESKGLLRLEPGHEFQGRVYDEALLVFRDEI